MLNKTEDSSIGSSGKQVLQKGGQKLVSFSRLAGSAALEFLKKFTNKITQYHITPHPITFVYIKQPSSFSKASAKILKKSKYSKAKCKMAVQSGAILILMHLHVES